MSLDLKINNKRGFLLAEETLKIVLAVIAIGFLAYLLFSIYQSNQTSKNLEFAKESLNHLVEEINSERAQVEIYNPEGWKLGSWPHEVTEGFLIFTETSTQMPLSCSNLGWESCICICEDNNADSCDNKGVCVNKEFQLEEDNIELTNLPVTLAIDYENKKISEVK